MIENVNQSATYVDEISGRQKWDKGYFASKAVSGETSEKSAIPPPLERKTLQHRKKKINLEKDVGKQKIITSETARQEQGGFWCDSCKCLMKDSQSYLDHINGKKHNRQLGHMMRVERIENADIIREKLRKAKISLIEEKEKKNEFTDIDGVKLKIKKLLESKAERKQRKKEEKKKKKQKTALKENQTNKDNNNNEDDDEYIMENTDVFALMNSESITIPEAKVCEVV